MQKLRDVLARLSDIKALAEKAGKGPWRVGGIDCPHVIGPADSFHTSCLAYSPGVDPRAVVGFMAEARTDVPALVEALEEARALLSRILEAEDGFVEDTGIQPDDPVSQAVEAIREALGPWLVRPVVCPRG